MYERQQSHLPTPEEWHTAMDPGAGTGELNDHVVSIRKRILMWILLLICWGMTVLLVVTNFICGAPCINQSTDVQNKVVPTLIVFAGLAGILTSVCMVDCCGQSNEGMFSSRTSNHM